MIEPILECVLDTGNPRYQVPRFQSRADRSNEKIIERQIGEPTFVIRSAGSKFTIAKATVPEEVSTPIKLHTRPDDRQSRRKTVRINHRGHRTGVS
jgi:hypothetical protein